jgi:hypothetical protein
MANNMKNEVKKVSEIDTRIAEKMRDRKKAGEKGALVCVLDNETFERGSDLKKWVKKIHRMSSTEYIELLTRRVMELEAKEDSEAEEQKEG